MSAVSLCIQFMQQVVTGLLFVKASLSEVHLCRQWKNLRPSLIWRRSLGSGGLVLLTSRHAKSRVILLVYTWEKCPQLNCLHCLQMLTLVCINKTSKTLCNTIWRCSFSSVVNKTRKQISNTDFWHRTIESGLYFQLISHSRTAYKIVTPQKAQK